MKADSKEITQKLNEAGYKFLGWANGWNENPPDYIHCLGLKHNRHNISHNNRGSENTVSCDICRIYWKYDCSD